MCGGTSFATGRRHNEHQWWRHPKFWTRISGANPSQLLGETTVHPLYTYIPFFTFYHQRHIMYTTTAMTSSELNKPSSYLSTATITRRDTKHSLELAGNPDTLSTRSETQSNPDFKSPAPVHTLHRKRSSYDLRYVFRHGSENRDAVIHHIQDGRTVPSIAAHWECGLMWWSHLTLVATSWSIMTTIARLIFLCLPYTTREICSTWTPGDKSLDTLGLLYPSVLSTCKCICSFIFLVSDSVQDHSFTSYSQYWRSKKKKKTRVSL